MTDSSSPEIWRAIEVADTEIWSENDVRITVTDHDVRGSTSNAMRFSDAEAYELMGKLATHLLAKGFLTVEKPEEAENECGDYPAPCNHDPAHS